jgi:hypothetical protein
MYFYVSTRERRKGVTVPWDFNLGERASERTPDVKRVFGFFRRIALGSVWANHFRRRTVLPLSKQREREREREGKFDAGEVECTL